MLGVCIERGMGLRIRGSLPSKRIVLRLIGRVQKVV